MRVDHNKPEAKIYDLHVNGSLVTDWVMADEATGEYELFVTDVPWRGGGKIPDTDNPTGFQTLKQNGKVEFKRNDLPAPSSDYGEKATQADEAAWNNVWGGFPGYCSPLQSIDNPGNTIASSAGGHLGNKTSPSFGEINGDLQEKWQKLSPAVQQFISERVDTEPIWPPVVSFEEWRKKNRRQFQKSVTFTSDDGKSWLMHAGRQKIGGVRFVDTHVTGAGMSVTLYRLDEAGTREPASLEIMSPGLSWSHECHQSGYRRSFTLTAYCEDYKARGLKLFQWLDSLEIWIRQEVGLPV